MQKVFLTRQECQRADTQTVPLTQMIKAVLALGDTSRCSDDQFVEMLLNFQLSTVDQIECFNQRSLLPCPRNFLFDAHQSYLVTRQ